MGIFAWFAATLRQYPEIAIFLALALGYYFREIHLQGYWFGIGHACGPAGGCIDRTDGDHYLATAQSVCFLMFLFAVGYGVGPQFVRGVAKGWSATGNFSLQFNARSACWSLSGYASSLVTIWGIPLAFTQDPRRSLPRWAFPTDAINRLGLAGDEAKKLLDSMPVTHTP